MQTGSVPVKINNLNLRPSISKINKYWNEADIEDAKISSTIHTKKSYNTINNQISPEVFHTVILMLLWNPEQKQDRHLKM